MQIVQKSCYGILLAPVQNESLRIEEDRRPKADYS